MKPSVPMANVPSASQYSEAIERGAVIDMAGSFRTKMVGHLGVKQKNFHANLEVDSNEDLREGDAHEAIKSLAIFLNPGPQQRALVRVEQKGGQVRRRRISRDR